MRRSRNGDGPPAASPPEGACYSCPWIEGRLVFAVEKLLLCCVSNHGRGCPKVCDFRRGPLPLDRIVSTRDEVRRKNQEERHHPLCEDCGWLEKRVWEKRDALFDHLTIAHFTKCNLACTYCYVTRGEFQKKPAVPYDVFPLLQQIVDEELLSPQGFVFWGGGEPAIFEGFAPSFRLIMDYGVEQAVSTNATILSEALIQGLEKRMASLVCTVDAGTAETYRKIKNRDFFERVWRNIETYVKTGGRVDAKMIIMEENLHEITPFLDRVQQAGVKNVVFDVNFHVQEQTDRVVDAIAQLHYEAVLKRGLNIIEGGSGVPAFGEELRSRIHRRLDERVTWEDVRAMQRQVREARAMRFARELGKYPVLRKIASKGFNSLEKAYLRFRSGRY